LEEALKETYGVIVYQEQVMQVAQIIAGFSLGHADELRRIMGKKIKEKMAREKEKFIAGAGERGFNEKKAGAIFDMLEPFAGYGFNKSHAAAYSVVAYRTAYLKANFPVEFMAANLTNEIHAADKDRLSETIAEARKMGIVIDPPDINDSQKLFSVVDGRIVYGLLGIKGLGDGPADEIVKGRRDGPYMDFMDFLNRVDIKAVGKSVIERLIRTGAFDKLGKRREILLGNLERAAEYVQNIKDDKKFGQGSLFGDAGEKEYREFEFEQFPELSRAEKLNIEKELIGFYFSAHPMDEYRELWQKLVKVDLGRIETLVPGQGQILVGLVKGIRPVTTGKGDKMAFASLEDYNGEIELTFFSGVWEKCRDKIEADKVAILRGKIDYQPDREKYSFSVEESLDEHDAEKAVKEEETLARKWDRYRNIRTYAKELGLNILDAGTAANAKPGTYTVLGTLKSLRTHVDKKGNEMAFGTLQDSGGEIDLLFFSWTWENCRALAAVDEIMAFKGTIDPAKDRNPARPGFAVSSIQDINKLLRSAAKKASSRPAEAGRVTDEAFREIHIRLAEAAAGNEEELYSLRDFLEDNPGACPVYIHVPSSGKETVIRASVDAGVPVASPAWSGCEAVAAVWGA
jgi:DNA polymerase-3 subunit alpha